MESDPGSGRTLHDRLREGFVMLDDDAEPDDCPYWFTDAPNEPDVEDGVEGIPLTDGDIEFFRERYGVIAGMTPRDSARAFLKFLGEHIATDLIRRADASACPRRENRSA